MGLNDHHLPSGGRAWGAFVPIDAQWSPRQLQLLIASDSRLAWTGLGAFLCYIDINYTIFSAELIMVSVL